MDHHRANVLPCEHCADGIAVRAGVDVEVCSGAQSTGPVPLYQCGRCHARFALVPWTPPPLPERVIVAHPFMEASYDE